MSDQTYQITLPSGLAEVFTLALEQFLRELGFQESLKAGEVGGVESSVWQREGAQVVITLHETGTEETITVSAREVDVSEIVKFTVARFILKLLEALPPKVRQSFESVSAQLRETVTSKL